MNVYARELEENICERGTWQDGTDISEEGGDCLDDQSTVSAISGMRTAIYCEIVVSSMRGGYGTFPHC